MGDAHRRDLPDAIHPPQDRSIVTRFDGLNRALSSKRPLRPSCSRPLLGVRGRLRKPEPIQSRVQAILWPAPNSRYQGPARRQSRGDCYRLTLNCWVAMGPLVPECRKQALALIEFLTTI
jgi:hypothetical protein